MSQFSNISDAVAKYLAFYNARPFKKRFIPIEKIAQNPTFFGYNVPGLNSNAKQQEFIECDKKVVGLIAANRSGKTEAGAIKALKICLDSKIDGEYWVLTESFDLQKSGVKVKIDDYLKPEFIIDREFAKKDVYKSLTIKNRNGKTVRIEFKSFEQGFSKLQSAKILGAWIDEEPPENVYDEVYLRTVDLSAQLILTFTPRRGKTWTFKRLFQSDSDQIKIFNWGMADNPFIPKNEIDELKRQWSLQKVRMCLFGEYVSSEGAVFSNFNRETHLKPLEYRPELETYISVDWGIRFTDIGVYQYNKTADEHYLIDHLRLHDHSYSKVMSRIIRLPYRIDDYFCDPAGSARSQATKSGKSLLLLIQDEFNIQFKYVRSSSIEEGVSIVDSYFMNSEGRARFFINSNINHPDDVAHKFKHPATYLEDYVRDEKTNDPIKDGVNDHFCDQMRYYFVNMIRSTQNSKFQQR